MKVVIFTLWLMVNMFAVIGGLIATAFPPYTTPCDKSLSKIEYVIPGFQVGCWLGTPWEK